MSLILEALKKSEAKRRLGEAPDLGTPFTTPKRRNSLLPMLLIAIAVAGALGWWLTRTPTPRPEAAAAGSSAPALTAPKAATGSKSPAAHVAAAPQAPSFDAAVAPPKVSGMPHAGAQRGHDVVAPLAPPPAHTGGSVPQVVSIAERAKSGGYDGRPQVPAANKRLPPNMHRIAPEAKSSQPGAPAVAAAAPATASSSVATRGKTRKTMQTPGIAPTPAVAAAPPATTSAPAVPPAAAPANQTQSASAQPVAVAQTPATVAAAPPAATAAPAPSAAAPAQLVVASATPAPAASATPSSQPEAAKAKSDVQFYYELPFSVRKALPTLRLSMHVYAGDPAQRFVVLNDSRLSEGDKTADDVTLREVRRDGAVLEFQGQRFFFPRDGQ